MVGKNKKLVCLKITQYGIYRTHAHHFKNLIYGYTQLNHKIDDLHFYRNELTFKKRFAKYWPT